ncbi:hypothetical protein HAX54_015696 [Datura stramonium]|uniref:Uncharacterized protein n=1 Tax=Datura stramonium TaxID=4076 RepID=A0ABS8Y2Q4_DATST|nr:hypothetical protein [Datura stramonium]
MQAATLDPIPRNPLRINAASTYIEVFRLMTPQRTSRPCIVKHSDPTDKEALRKAKKDEERRDELHHKRGKDALQFNSLPGMKERFFEGTRIKTSMKRGRYFPMLVHEFYALHGAAQKHQKATGPLRSRPCLEKVKGRGVEVDCSSKAINNTYFDDDAADATGYLAKLENPEDHYTWVASLIAAGMPTSVKDVG